MMKKSLHLLALALILSLPSCKKDKKGDKSKTPQKMALGSGQFSPVNMPLADGEDVAPADESVKSFFDRDMDEFVAFSDADDMGLAQAGQQDEFSLINAGDAQKGLEVVHFDFDKHNIRANEKEKVERNAQKVQQLLADGTGSTVVVEGHACASAGSRAYNLALSEKRAKECADYLKSSGVPAESIKTVGRGQEMLVVKSGSREEQAPNRRVELHVVS